MKTLILILTGTLCCGALVGSGFVVGRQFPVHHYEKLLQSPFLLDSATGRICVVDFPDQNPDISSPAIDSLKDANNKMMERNLKKFPPCEQR